MSANDDVVFSRNERYSFISASSAVLVFADKAKMWRGLSAVSLALTSILGASSTIRCAFVPVNPKLLMPALRMPASLLQSVGEVII